jgi:hypothetical protein
MAAKPLSDSILRRTAELYQEHGIARGAEMAGLRPKTFESRVTTAINQGFCTRADAPLRAGQHTPAEVRSVDHDALRRRLLNGSMTLEQIMARFNCSEAQARDSIESLHRLGLNVRDHGGNWHIDKGILPMRERGSIPVYLSSEDGTYRFGFTSDNHIGSKYARDDVLNKLYDNFAAANVDRVLNAGNWIDGEARFNRNDLLIHGMQAQLDFLVDKYPQRKGIVTYAVAGDDHEGWYCQREGVDIGRMAERTMRDNGRTDWVDLGYMEAFIELQHAASGKSTMLHLVHPGGGSAYAVSYTVQKIVESYSGGEKPAVLLAGHYHKMSYNFFRNVHCIQTGCFTANTLIETSKGRKRISDIVVGDEVITHRGRSRKVTKLFSRPHDGNMVALNYSRRGRPDQTITATPEHPVLIERNDGSRIWMAISDIKPGDVIFVRSGKCEVTGEQIPFFMKMGRNANPMDKQSVRDKLSATKGGKVRTRGGSDGAKHMAEDVLPFCATMSAAGWRMVPVGADVIPDAIGFKDGQAVAFEVEKTTGRVLAHKMAKYEGSEIAKHVDAVEWVNLAQRAKQPRSWYDADGETGFCKVLVVGVNQHALNRTVRVYNFEVDEDNSYVAGNVVVHNCTEDQTPFMRKKKLHADVGGGICELHQDARTGAIDSCRIQFFPFFVRDFYNDRWSMSNDVILADRGA